MRAATSDNVQPLALIACEKFGATLAVCPETNKKMEDLIIKVSGPKHVRFMRAQIGYSANDSATQLSRSLAGIQFLGLAAALTSSVDMFDGANALSEMLMDSASDKTLLPTTRQLKDLLVAMEHRLNRSGFADMWVGYQILLSGGLCALYGRECWGRERWVSADNQGDVMQIPKSDGISNLVKAFRQLNRLGDAAAITIRATSCAPWLMAFTRWCLGIPPSTILPNRAALLDQPASRITLFIDKVARRDDLEISVQRSIGSPADLLKSQAVISNFHSMTTVECFGQKICHEMGGKGSLAYRAMCEALPYALKQSCELLRLSQDSERYPTTVTGNQSDILGRAYRCHALPEDFIISSVLTKVFNLESQQYLQRLDDHEMISDLPLVREHLHKSAKGGCTCNGCRKRVMKPHRTDDSASTCGMIKDNDMIKNKFLRDISYHAANILTLSLFESPETLLVSVPPIQIQRQLLKAVHHIIISGEPTVCTIKEILAWARRLVGHKDPGDDDSWVITSYKGQAVYPRVYETCDICQPGYLVLRWAPGLLFFDGEVYDRGIGPPYLSSNGYETDPLSMQPLPPVTEPLNLLPKMKMEWKVVRHDGYLGVYPACGNHVGKALNILFSLSRALILGGCPHDSASPLEKPDLLSRYRSPTDARKLSVTEEQIGVVAVDGDAGLRMFALSESGLSYPKNTFVIRNNACLQCCLDLCRRAGYRSVIC